MIPKRYEVRFKQNGQENTTIVRGFGPKDASDYVKTLFGEEIEIIHVTPIVHVSITSDWTLDFTPW